MQFLTEKLYIGLEHAPPTFDVRSKVLGSEVVGYLSGPVARLLALAYTAPVNFRAIIYNTFTPLPGQL